MTVMLAHRQIPLISTVLLMFLTEIRANRRKVMSPHLKWGLPRMKWGAPH
jgi:hypothetical protein